MIWIGIPTGQRTEQAIEVARQWKSKGINVIVYAWDEDTYNGMEGISDIRLSGFRESFAKLQNKMIDLVGDFTAYICGADDLYPVGDYNRLEQVAKDYNGKIIHIRDGIHQDLPTHPVITKDWYNKNKKVFDEGFYHNYCDTDLYHRVAKKGEIVRVNDMSFDHRHPIKTGKPSDAVYQLGAKHFQKDKMYFAMKHSREVNFMEIPYV